MDIDALEQTLAAARQMQDTQAIAQLLFELGMARHENGDDPTAIICLEEASTLAGQMAEEPLGLRAQTALAHLLRQQGDAERARMLYQDALRRLRDANITTDERDNLLGQTFLGLGRLFEAEGQREAAQAAWQRSLGFFQRGGHAEWAELLRHLLSSQTDN